MRKNWKNNWIAYGMVALLMLTSCAQESKHAKHADTYTCPMHPTVVSDKPGTCPVCGMNLVRKAGPGEEVEIGEDLAKLIKSPNETAVASIKTIKGQYESIPVSIEVQGVVTYDTRNIYTIASRVDGRLEKIFLKYEFQSISRGDKVAEIYSPALITAQRELLFLLENDSENSTLINAAKSKLELLGLTRSQINDFISRKEVTNTVSIYSPYSGYLISNAQVPAASPAMMSTSTPSGGSMNDGMSELSSNSSLASDQNYAAGSVIEEGSYVSAGQTLFRIVDNNRLRIEFDLPTMQAGIVKEGDKLELDLREGGKENATIDFVQPFFSDGQDFLKLRVYTEVKGLRIGQLVNGVITLPAIESLWIPKEAVLSLGATNIVFIKEKGVFKPKTISTGTSSGKLIEVKSGLASADEIAANAQYLMDSESFIKTTK